MNDKNEQLVGRTDWANFDALTEEQLMAAASADPDAQPLSKENFKDYHRLPRTPGNNFLDRIRLARGNKTSLTVRYDTDVVNFFKDQGRGYQRLMNNILRAYMEANTPPLREVRQA